jgi:hypothetical protein
LGARAPPAKPIEKLNTIAETTAERCILFVFITFSLVEGAGLATDLLSRIMLTIALGTSNCSQYDVRQ